MVRKWFVLSIPGVRRINHCAVAEPQKQTQTASFLRSKMVGGRADGLLGGGEVLEEKEGGGGDVHSLASRQKE